MRTKHTRRVTLTTATLLFFFVYLRYTCCIPTPTKGLVDKDGAAVDPRGGSIGRLVFSANSDGKLKAFRGVRKLASRTRKAMKGGSGSRDAELTEEQVRW